MHQQEFSACFSDFKAVTWMFDTRKAPSWSSLVLWAVHTLRKHLPLKRWNLWNWLDHTENLRVSPSCLVRIKQESFRDPVSSRLRPTKYSSKLARWSSWLWVLAASFLSNSSGAGCPRGTDLPRFSPGRSSALRKEFIAIAPCIFESYWSWGVPVPASRRYFLAWNERADDGFGQSVWCFPYSTRLADSRADIEAWRSVHFRVQSGDEFCFRSGRTSPVVVDYFSNFIEVDSLSSETFKSVS